MSSVPSTLRILHCSCFHHRKYGAWFESIDAKLTRGLTMAGHFVYDFSYRDVAKNEAILPSKKLGARKANEKLIECANHLQADILLLGHSEIISNETIRAIRKQRPNIKVATWYCDPLWVPEKFSLLKSKAEISDAIFTTSGGSVLKELGNRSCRVSHFPNPVDSAIESGRSFERSTWTHDLIFTGTEKGEPDRTALLKEILLLDNSEFEFRIHKAFDRPPISGQAYLDAVESAMCGLNLSRRWDVPWYTSDRLAHLAGNGTVVFSPKTEGLVELIGESGAVWFSTSDEVHSKLRELKNDPDQARSIAKTGWENYHRNAATQDVCEWMLEFLFEANERSVPWSQQRA